MNISSVNLLHWKRWIWYILLEKKEEFGVEVEEEIEELGVFFSEEWIYGFDVLIKW
jgi:hypothetical protein